MISFTTLRKLAAKEAENLKEVATDYEINRLDPETLEATDMTMCIYGQMTGHCNSPRANELIMRCATRVYDTTQAKTDTLKECKLGGEPYKVGEALRTLKFISPIELIIHRDIDSGPKIISYLKGETETLIL